MSGRRGRYSLSNFMFRFQPELLVSIRIERKPQVSTWRVVRPCTTLPKEINSAMTILLSSPSSVRGESIGRHRKTKFSSVLRLSMAYLALLIFGTSWSKSSAFICLVLSDKAICFISSNSCWHVTKQVFQGPASLMEYSISVYACLITRAFGAEAGRDVGGLIVSFCCCIPP